SIAPPGPCQRARALRAENRWPTPDRSTAPARADGGDEGGDRRGVLATRRRLDATGDVDHPRPDPGDPLGDVLGSQAAGQDQPGQGGSRIEEGGVDRRPGPAHPAGDVGIDEYAFGGMAEGVGPREEIRDDPPTLDRAEPECPDDPERGERREVFGGLLT